MRERWPDEGDWDLARRMASQQGSPEGVWALVAVEEEEEAVQVVSEPEEVQRLMSLVVVAVEVDELKLRLCKSSARSSSHGSIGWRKWLLERERGIVCLVKKI